MDVFTYGSLMFREVWLRVAGCDCESVPAVADGYAVRRLREVPWPVMIPAAGESARGRLYRGVPDIALARLDRFEGEEYHRVPIDIRLPDGSLETAHAYLAAEPESPEILPDPWDAATFERDGLAAFLREFVPAANP